MLVGVVYLRDRKVRVERPRLRRRGAGEGGEVEVPAEAAMRRPGAVADRMLEILMAGGEHAGVRPGERGVEILRGDGVDSREGAGSAVYPKTVNKGRFTHDAVHSGSVGTGPSCMRR